MRPNIDDRALARLPQNVVTRALGMEPNIRVSMRTHRMLAGDRYLLCSDGLSDTVDEDTMGDVLAIERAPDEVVRALIQKALLSDARDNIAAIVVSASLAEGAVAVPRVVHQVRRPESMPPLPDDDSPEIVILDEDDDGPSVHVVPSQSATDDDMIEALEDFSKNR